MSLAAWAKRYKASRPPDVVIGSPERPYMLRWHVVPRNRFLNVYLHEIRRSDDDRALHDHPWFNVSLILIGAYVEHTVAAGGVQRTVWRIAGDITMRRAASAHRLSILGGACTTLFVTGPKSREWGFHCPHAGWRGWREYTGEGGTLIGRGCD